MSISNHRTVNSVISLKALTGSRSDRAVTLASSCEGGLWRGGLAESGALIKALEPGDQHAALIVNGNEGINAVCITIDRKSAFSVAFRSRRWKWQAQRCRATRRRASRVKISSRRYPSLCKWMVICTAVCARCSIPQSWCKKNWMTVSKTAVIIKLITKCWWCP